MNKLSIALIEVGRCMIALLAIFLGIPFVSLLMIVFSIYHVFIKVRFSYPSALLEHLASFKSSETNRKDDARSDEVYDILFR